MVIWHLKQIGKVKKFDKCVPSELTENKKIVLKKKKKKRVSTERKGTDREEGVRATGTMFRLKE